MRAGATVALAVIATAGCYRGGGATGECEVVCSDDSQCPSGLVCGTAGRCVGMRAASCADVGPDGPPADAEPPPDARDCTMGTDEDSDGLVNGCDPCPISSNDSTDVDGDQVAQACDPRDRGGFGPERHFFFDGFETVLKRYEAFPEMNIWDARIGGDGDVSSTGLPELAHLTWRLPRLPTNVLVAASVTVHQASASGAWIAVGRAIGGTSSADASGQGCLLAVDGGQGSLIDLPSNVHASDAVPYVQGQRLLIAAWWSPSDGVQCRFGDIDMPSPDPFGAALTAPAANQVGVAVHGADVSVHWLMVVESL